MPVILFTVPAVPVAQPRQRHRIIAGKSGPFVHNYTPADSPVNSFKASVRQAFREVYDGAPLLSAVNLSVTFVMPRPKRLIWKNRPMPRQPHIGKPDLGNLVKSLEDALSKLAYHDDSQIAALDVVKMHAAGDEQPHVEVAISHISMT